MPVDPGDFDTRASNGAAELLARAAAADGRMRAAVVAAAEDIALPLDARLDDRTRAAIQATLDRLIGTLERALAEETRRLLLTRGETPPGDHVECGASVAPRLLKAGLLRDGDFVGEVIARTQQDLLAAALTPTAPDEEDRPSLLPRLAEHSNPRVAEAAMLLIAADSRRMLPAAAASGGTDLPAELHRRLLWRVAAALGEGCGAAPDASVLEGAFADAALRLLARYDESERTESAAARLAMALDARGEALEELLVEALGDRRLTLFIALLARALGTEYEAAREVVIDPAGDRLWLALRAVGLSRDAIARVGVLLAEAEPARDLEALADAIEVVETLSPDVALTALAPLRLPAEYRAARAVLIEAGRR